MNLPMAPPHRPADAHRRRHQQRSAEVRALAAERDAVILAHNYQVPEVQDVADYVGDSLGLSRRRPTVDADVIAFCGVHFMAETASILSPEKTVLIPDLDAGCSLADSITPDAAAGLAGQAPRRGDGHVRQHDGRDQGADRLLRARRPTPSRSSSTSSPSTGRTPRSSSAPTCCSAPTSRRSSGITMHVWDGECHVHAGIRPADIDRDPRRAPRRRLPHPPRVRLLDVGHGVRGRRRRRLRGRAHALHRRDARLRRASTPGDGRAPRSWPPRPGCCTRCGMAAPDVDFIAANEAACCRYMKMITLPKLRDCLRDMTRRGQGARATSPSAPGSRSSAWSRSPEHVRGRRPRPRRPAAHPDAAWLAEQRADAVAIVVGRDGALIDGDAPARVPLG